jgi:hypothetical protein
MGVPAVEEYAGGVDMRVAAGQAVDAVLEGAPSRRGSAPSQTARSASAKSRPGIGTRSAPRTVTCVPGTHDGAISSPVAPSVPSSATG